MDALLGTAQAFEQGRQFIDIGRQAADNWDEFQKWRESQQAAAPAPEPPDKSAWDYEPGPKFDPAWAAQLDEFGNIRPGADPAIAQQITRHRQGLEQRSREFFHDPRKVIGQATEDQFAERPTLVTVDERIAAAITADRAQRENDEYFRTHQAEFYQVDASGQVRRNPQTGEALYTAKGQAMTDYAVHGQRLGITDPTALREFAEAKVAADTATGRFGQSGGLAAPSPAAPSPATDYRENFLQAALERQPSAQPVPYNSDGTITRSPNEPLIGRHKTPEEMAADVLRQFGDIA